MWKVERMGGPAEAVWRKRLIQSDSPPACFPECKRDATLDVLTQTFAGATSQKVWGAQNKVLDMTVREAI